MAKSPEAFRTISEVAEWLDTPAHVLRFWESRFSQIKPVKRAGGRRYYRPGDMLLLGGIKKLLHEDGMTIKGAQKLLKEQGVKHVAALSQPLETQLKDLPDVGGVVIEGKASDVTTGRASPLAPPTEAPPDEKLHPTPDATEQAMADVPVVGTETGEPTDTRDKASESPIDQTLKQLIPERNEAETQHGDAEKTPDAESTDIAADQQTVQPQQTPTDASEPANEFGSRPIDFTTSRQPLPDAAPTDAAAEEAIASHPQTAAQPDSDSSESGKDDQTATPQDTDQNTDQLESGGTPGPVPRIIEVTMTPPDELPEPEVAVVLKQLRGIDTDLPEENVAKITAVYRRLTLLHTSMSSKSSGSRPG